MVSSATDRDFDGSKKSSMVEDKTKSVTISTKGVT